MICQCPTQGPGGLLSLHPDTELHQLCGHSFAQPWAFSTDHQQLISARRNSTPCMSASQSTCARGTVCGAASATHCCLDWLSQAARCVQCQWRAPCAQRWGLGHYNASESSVDVQQGAATDIADICYRRHRPMLVAKCPSLTGAYQVIGLLGRRGLLARVSLLWRCMLGVGGQSSILRIASLSCRPLTACCNHPESPGPWQAPDEG